MLDRWSVSVVTTSKGFRKGQKDRQLIMNNYLGIGVDGQVALDFHKVTVFVVHVRQGYTARGGCVPVLSSRCLSCQQCLALMA